MSDPLTSSLDPSAGASSAGIEGIEQRANIKTAALDGAADYADAAHDLAQKKAKLAHQAHHSGEEADSSIDNDADSNNTPEEQGKKRTQSRSALGQAWSESRHKFIEGGLMFAGFSILLTAMSAITGVGFESVGNLFSGSEAAGTAGQAATEVAKQGGQALSYIASGLKAVVAASLTGALWLGGTEFKKQYQEISHENTRLHKAFNSLDKGLDKAKERLRLSEKERAPENNLDELNIMAGSLSSHLGTTAFLVEVPTLATQQPQTSAAIQEILAQGPKGQTRALLQRSTSSAAERIENAEQNNQSISV